MAYADRRDGRLTGRWIGEVELKHGATEKRFRRRFETKGEAEGYEAYVRATGQEPPGTTQTPVGTYADIAQRFRDHEPTWGRKDPSAIQRLEWMVERLGKLDINAVTTIELDKVVAKLRTLGLSNRTINRYLDAGAKPLDYAHKRSLLRAGMPHVPRVADKGNDRTRVLSFDAEDAVCRWLEQNRPLRGYDYAFAIRVLCETGFRRGELWKLEPDQIGNTSITLRRDQTKTDAARSVPIPAEMATKLRAMIRAKTLPSYAKVYAALKEAAQAVGEHEEITIHSLRHTRGTRLIEAGVDPLTTAKLLGHSNVQTTKRYVHQSEDFLAKAAEKVHRSRGGVVEEKGSVWMFPSKKVS